MNPPIPFSAHRRRDFPGFRLALVSCPWPILGRPSIQLGALCAYLRAELPWVSTETVHLYLDVGGALGPDTYTAVASGGWPAETVYAALLSPHRLDEFQPFFQTRAREKGVRVPPLSSLLDPVRQATHQAMRHLVEAEYDLYGFTLSLAQWTSTLYCIRELKRLAPNIRIVTGGTHCAGMLGKTLIQAVPEIDFLVSGEGELPLKSLVRRLAGREQEWGANILHRNPAGEIQGELCPGASQIALSHLPVPEYEEYFQRLGKLSALRGLEVTLPVEAGRGCWWQAAPRNRDDGGCRFCNLNLQWRGFRRKPASQVSHDVETLSSRHEVLKFFFVDNVLSLKSMRTFQKSEARSPVDRTYFGEFRAPLAAPDVNTLKRGGFTRVQVGIEALSTSLLRRMNKGVGALENLWTMKLLEEADIRNESNLILGFPGSTPEEVRETLETIQAARWYAPLVPVWFWLGYGSPVHRNPKRFGIRYSSNHPHYRILLPDDMHTRLCLMTQTYRGDRTIQVRRWKPVLEALRAWKRHYTEVKKRYPRHPLLGWQEGGRFLIVRERRVSAPALNHRFRGLSAELYRFCLAPKSLQAVHRRFPSLEISAIVRFWQDLEQKGLAFREGERCLSLAVRDPK